MPGILYVIGMPIGNLDDLSVRALRILRAVNFIAAEEPAVTRRLLEHYGLSVPVTSYHNLNKETKTPVILERLYEGEDAALVCDAGTPALADPGAFLIRRTLEAGLRVSPIPGPSAVATAVSVSGLAADRFLFLGMLPQRPSQRRRLLMRIARAQDTTVLFVPGAELCHVLNKLEGVLKRRRVVLVTDATMPEEFIVTGQVKQLRTLITAHGHVNECTLVIEGRSARKKPIRQVGRRNVIRRRAFE